MTTTACPSHERLLQFLAEPPGTPEGEPVGVHIRSCAVCQQALEELTMVPPSIAPWLLQGAGDPTPLPWLPLPEQAWPEVPGYEVLGVLGQGGMGIVYKARQSQLGRLVALKMIQPRAHAGGKELARFRTEAEAVACLQHPHIVQIHEVGEYQGKPFLSLEFCAGGSLETRLNSAPLPPRQAAELVQQLAGAMHAAHGKGVLHRDLKPGNVLLTEDGTPRITDFGLAKKLDAAGQTQSGTVLGTPSYMAPEQAGGKSKELGPTADVYALGAILYECLTGRPPFKATTPLETLRQVVDDEPVRPGQLQPRVPRDLETICLKCLEKSPARRYPSAEVLADDLGRFLRGEPVQARPTGVLMRGLKWARRRPAAAALVVVCALLLALAGGGGVWYLGVQADRAAEQARQTAEQARQEARQAERKATMEREVTAVLENTRTLKELARGLTANPDQWRATLAAALASAGQAKGILDLGEPTPELREEVLRVLAELNRDDSGRDLLAKLEDIRLEQAEVRSNGNFDFASSAPRYAAAFREHGLDLLGLEPAEAAQRLQMHPHREALLAAVNNWARSAPSNPEQRRLIGILHVLDPDPASFPNRWRDALARSDRTALERLATEQAVPKLPSVTLVHLARDLREIGSAETAVRLLEEARRRHPGDFWINYELGWALAKLHPPREDDAIIWFRVALALRPRCSLVHNDLGQFLRSTGRRDEAVRCFRQALELEPRCPVAHRNLGLLHLDRKEWDQAIDSFRQALSFHPGYARAYLHLGQAFQARKELGPALCCYRKAIELEPGLGLAHLALGNLVKDTRGAREAIPYLRNAVRLIPRSIKAHHSLGVALLDIREWAQAIEPLGTSVELDPGCDRACVQLGRALRGGGQVGEAICCYRKALELDPRSLDAHNRLGALLRANGYLDESIVCFQTAIGLAPRDFQAHLELGLAEQQRGQFAKALASLKRARAVLPPTSPSLPDVVKHIGETQRWLERERKLSTILTGEAKPTNADEGVQLAWLCQQPDQRSYATAARLYTEAFASKPTLAANHRSQAAYAAALAGCGQGEEGRRLDENERARLRQRALTWLRADLARAKTHLNAGQPAERVRARQQLQRWQQDTELAGVRDQPLADRPAPERAAWQTFWTEVADLLERGGTSR